MIRHVIDAHKLPIPAVLEIPSKDHPYDANKDSIMRRAKGLFSAEDYRWSENLVFFVCFSNSRIDWLILMENIQEYPVYTLYESFLSSQGYT